MVSVSESLHSTVGTSKLFMVIVLTITYLLVEVWD